MSLKNLVNNQINKGMILETLINESNEYYLTQNIAVIHKKPTPITIVRVDYPVRNKAKITEAYYKTPSTTDYNGIYNGHYIDFEAKETTSKTSFPLNNIHKHQINHLKQITNQKGIGFLIIRFSTLDEVYLIEAKQVFQFWDKMDSERKSIPYQYFKSECYLIKEGYQPRLDYLKVINALL